MMISPANQATLKELKEAYGREKEAYTTSLKRLMSLRSGRFLSLFETLLSFYDTENPSQSQAVNLCLAFTKEVESLSNRFNFLKIFAESSLTQALHILRRADLLSPDTLSAVLTNNDPEGLADAFDILQKAALLSTHNQNAISAHNDPQALADSFKIMKEADLLNVDNRAAILARNQPCGLFADALFILSQNQILTQSRFKRLLQHSPILCVDHNVWTRIPRLTIAHFNRILAIAQEAANPQVGRVAFVEYVNRDILGLNPAEAEPKPEPLMILKARTLKAFMRALQH